MRDSRKGVIALPVMPCDFASASAYCVIASISSRAIAAACGTGVLKHHAARQRFQRRT
jgi:hypothetical protein